MSRRSVQRSGSRSAVIDAVLFDLDGTLFDRDQAVARVLARQVEQFAHLIRPGQAATFIRRVQALDAHGHRDKREVYATIGMEFGFDAATVWDLLASFWADYPGCCRLDDGVADTLAALRHRGKRLGIVTNGSTVIQRAVLQAVGVAPAVDTVVISEAEGVRKPAEAIFWLASTRLGVPVERCCFVGDNPEVDVLGVQRAGLQAFWKRTTFWRPPEPVPTIDAISDLLDLIA